jgi:hypothetical protein
MKHWPMRILGGEAADGESTGDEAHGPATRRLMTHRPT